MPNTFHGYIVWFIVTLFVVYSFCLNTAAAVFNEPIRNTLHTSDLGASIALSAFILGFACMQIPAGYLLDKYNAKFIVSLGVLLLATGNLITSISYDLISFTLSNFLQGIGASFAFIAAGVVTSQWFPAKFFPILFGLTQTLSCILTAVIHYIFILALQSHPWNKIYQILAVFGVILFFLTVLLVKSPDNHIEAQEVSLKKSLSIVLKDSQIWLCVIAATFSFGALLAYASFWYLRIQQYYAIEMLQAVIIGGMIFIGIGVGTPLLGWISNQYKSRKLVLHVSLVLGCAVLLLCLYLPHFNSTTLIPIKIISFLLGFLLSGSMLYYTVVSELSSHQTRGVALSITNTGVFLFNTLLLFIPLLFITNISQTFFSYLWLLPFCVLIAILLNYFIKETYSANRTE